MKPKIPIQVWSTPPDPVDGLLGDSQPPRVAASLAVEASPREQPARETPRNITPRPRPAARVQDSSSPAAAKVHMTLYLDPEDVDLLRTEQMRRVQELRRPKRGVTDASAIVRDLIRRHLR